MQYLILAASRYDFKNDQGEAVSGVKVWYVDAEPEVTDNRAGCAPMKANLPLRDWADFGKLPGIYDMDFRMRPGADNKPTLACTGVRYVGAVDFRELLEPVSSSGAK